MRGKVKALASRCELAAEGAVLTISECWYYVGIIN